MDLVEWIRRQYAADEKWSRHIHQQGCSSTWWEHDRLGYDVKECDCTIPTDIRARLAMARCILELHPTTISKGYQVTDGWFTPEPYCECQAEDGVIYDQEPCETKRLLVLPYAKREGYRQEWRPQG